MPENARRTLIVGLNYAPEPTGNAPYTAGLAAALAAAGDRVEVITTHPHYPQWRRYPNYSGWRRRTREDGVAVTRLRHYVPRHPSPTRRLVAELSFGWRAVCQRWGRPDVVVAPSPALFATALVVAKAGARRVPSVVWVQDLYSRAVGQTGQGGGAMARAVAAVEAWTLRRSSHVVIAHPRFRDYVCADVGVEPDRVSVVANWSHVTAPSGDRSGTRARLGWGADEIIALHAGNMGAKQGLEVVVEAGALARASGSPVRFVLLGDGNQRPALERLAHQGAAVDFVDPVAERDLPDTLAAADVLLVVERAGARDLAVPSKLTSYCAAGRPVVTCVESDGITAEATADYAEPATAVTPAALLAAVERVAADADLQRRRATAARNHWRAHMSAAASLDALGEAIAAAADGRR